LPELFQSKGRDGNTESGAWSNLAEHGLTRPRNILSFTGNYRRTSWTPRLENLSAATQIRPWRIWDSSSCRSTAWLSRPFACVSTCFEPEPCFAVLHCSSCCGSRPCQPVSFVALREWAFTPFGRRLLRHRALPITRIFTRSRCRRPGKPRSGGYNLATEHGSARWAALRCHSTHLTLTSSRVSCPSPRGVDTMCLTVWHTMKVSMPTQGGKGFLAHYSLGQSCAWWRCTSRAPVGRFRLHLLWGGAPEPGTPTRCIATGKGIKLMWPTIPGMEMAISWIVRNRESGFCSWPLNLLCRSTKS